MRGRAQPKSRASAAASTRKHRHEPSTVIAALTARSGRCVVASATRRSPATSSITGSGVAVRSARYSVWPVNGMPASLMMLFCTGAVTIAANSPLRQPSTARSMSAST